MRHSASTEFWAAYDGLPAEVRATADRCYGLLQSNPRHPSLHFKPVGRYWSVRVGIGYRALAVPAPDGFIWFWIGSHAVYDRMIRG